MNELNDLYNIFTTTMKIASCTISADLVNVNPISVDFKKIKQMEQEIKQENRENKISNALENVPYVEKTVKDHPDYKDCFHKKETSYYEFNYITNKN